MDKINKLNHVAFIMDGNGRWAKAQGLPRHLGHKEGCKRLHDIFDECICQNIKYSSLYAFSTENWNRPKDEISHLFTYLDEFFKEEIDYMCKNGCKLVISGEYKKLPRKTYKTICDALERTKSNNKFYINVCLNYGGKAEIVRAAQLFAEDVKRGKRISSLTEKNFNEYLYTKGFPPVDLLIRTSGELRTSNFLPYQLAYAEMMFPLTPWPEFTREKFKECIESYYKRDRRFGGIYE